MNKLKAFTIMEITVVMLLSSVVLSIGWMCYWFMVDAHDSFESDSQTVSSASKVMMILTKDVDDCALVSVEDNGFVCSSAGLDIVYSWDGDLLLRMVQDEVDTLASIRGLWAISEGHDAQSEDIIDQLGFELEVDDIWVQYQFEKNYDAEIAILRDDNGRN